MHVYCSHRPSLSYLGIYLIVHRLRPDITAHHLLKQLLASHVIRWLSSQQHTYSHAQRSFQISIMFFHFYPPHMNHLCIPPVLVCVCLCVCLHCCIFALASLGWLLQCLKGVHHCLCYLWAWFNWAGTGDAQSEACSWWLKHSQYWRQYKAVINGIYVCCTPNRSMWQFTREHNPLFLLLFFEFCINHLLIPSAWWLHVWISLLKKIKGNAKGLFLGYTHAPNQ